MAFCTKCGAPVADGAAFCTSCGQGVGQPVVTSGASAVRAFTVKNNILILALMGGLALSVLLSFISGLANDGGFFATLLSAVISALPVLAVFLLWSQGSKTGDYPTAGFTIIKVINIISIVLQSIAGFFLIICGLAVEAMSEFIGDLLDGIPDLEDALDTFVDIFGIDSIDGLFGMIAFIFFATGAYAIALIFLYNVPLNKNCNALKKMVLKNEKATISGLLPIMLWVNVGLSFIGIFIIPGGVLGVFGTLIGMATNACGALLLMQAKKELSC